VTKLKRKLPGVQLKVAGFGTNPYESIQIEHFEISGLTNRIYKTNLSKTGLRIKSESQGFVWIRPVHSTSIY